MDKLPSRPWDNNYSAIKSAHILQIAEGQILHLQITYYSSKCATPSSHLAGVKLDINRYIMAPNILIYSIKI